MVGRRDRGGARGGSGHASVRDGYAVAVPFERHPTAVWRSVNGAAVRRFCLGPGSAAELAALSRLRRQRRLLRAPTALRQLQAARPYDDWSSEFPPQDSIHRSSGANGSSSPAAIARRGRSFATGWKKGSCSGASAVPSLAGAARKNLEIPDETGFAASTMATRWTASLCHLRHRRSGRLYLDGKRFGPRTSAFPKTRMVTLLLWSHGKGRWWSKWIKATRSRATRRFTR